MDNVFFSYQTAECVRVFCISIEQQIAFAAKEALVHVGDVARYLRVHDLKHTYGHRLRAAGIGFEDRKPLLGHKAGHVTTHYSAPEIDALIQASEKVCELGSGKSHALTIVAARAKQQVLDFMVVREGLEPSTSAL